jgi:hypothetical protein
MPVRAYVPFALALPGSNRHTRRVERIVLAALGVLLIIVGFQMVRSPRVFYRRYTGRGSIGFPKPYPSDSQIASVSDGQALLTRVLGAWSCLFGGAALVAALLP